MRRGLLLLSLFPVLAWAQTYTASVRGTVTDSTQATVPAASVVLTEVDQNLKHLAKTDTAGRYVLNAVPPGHYTLEVELSGRGNSGRRIH